MFSWCSWSNSARVSAIDPDGRFRPVKESDLLGVSEGALPSKGLVVKRASSSELQRMFEASLAAKQGTRVMDGEAVLAPDRVLLHRFKMSMDQKRYAETVPKKRSSLLSQLQSRVQKSKVAKVGVA